MRINKNTVTLTDEEAKVLRAILGELTRNQNDLRNMVGSQYVGTAVGMQFVLSHMDYTRRHGVKAEDMDEGDYEQEYNEKYPCYDSDWEREFD